MSDYRDREAEALLSQGAQAIDPARMAADMRSIIAMHKATAERRSADLLQTGEVAAEETNPVAFMQATHAVVSLLLARAALVERRSIAAVCDDLIATVVRFEASG